MVDIEIWFVYSLQFRRDLTSSKATSVQQLHGQTCVVTIAGVPDTEVVDGRPNFGVLWQAEATFLEQQHQRLTDHHTIAWEARYGGSRGLLLSKYDVRVAAEED